MIVPFRMFYGHIIYIFSQFVFQEDSQRYYSWHSFGPGDKRTQELWVNLDSVHQGPVRVHTILSNTHRQASVRQLHTPYSKHLILAYYHVVTWHFNSLLTFLVSLSLALSLPLIYFSLSYSSLAGGTNL